MSEVISLYSDGGNIGRNPSPLGGTWAYRGLGANGACIVQDSGVLTPEECGLPTVSNNVAELAAAVFGLMDMPDGWSGTLFTDSEVTLLRVRKSKVQAKLNGVPESLIELLAAQKSRLHHYEVVLLGGHPTRLELFRGYNRDGLPVHWENFRCDKMCKDAGERFLKQRKKMLINA